LPPAAFFSSLLEEMPMKSCMPGNLPGAGIVVAGLLVLALVGFAAAAVYLLAPAPSG